MAMEQTKQLLKSYQNTAVNLRKVAHEMEKRDSGEGITASMVTESRLRAFIYENVAKQLELALISDRVDLNENTLNGE